MCAPVNAVFAEGESGIFQESHFGFVLFCLRSLSHRGPQLRFWEIKPEHDVLAHIDFFLSLSSKTYEMLL